LHSHPIVELKLQIIIDTLIPSFPAMDASTHSKSGSASSARVAIAYILFGGCALWVYHVIAEGEVSSLLTVSVVLQCLSFVLLALKVTSSSSAAGISARTLALDAVSLCCRLSSTLWLHGYLPSDASGDWMFQAADLCSLAMVIFLLYQVLVVHRDTYQVNTDTFGVRNLVVGAIMLSILLHADMNHKPVFDALWTMGLFIDSVSLFPQLWLISKNGGAVEAMTSHHIATMACSRLLAFAFWYLAREYVVTAPWVEGFNHGAWGILAAYAVQFLLLSDFVYHYVKACMSGLLGSGMPLICDSV